MARLNDPPPAASQETIEALKKRYIRQNREIARVNSTQSIRIRTLETENRFLANENLDLRAQLIKLQVELERRDQSRDLLYNVSQTKSALERKLMELTELVGGLKSEAEREKRPKIITEERRKRDNQPYVLAEGQLGLPSILEDVAPRRKSLGLDDVPILAPTSPNHPNDYLCLSSDEDEDTIPAPPTSAYLDMRPRRRRDSTIVTDLPIRSAPSPKSPSVPAHSPPSILGSIKKKKFEDFIEASPSPKPKISDGVDAFQFKIPEKKRSGSMRLENQDPVKASTLDKEGEGIIRQMSNPSLFEEARRLSGGNVASVRKVNGVEEHIRRLSGGREMLQQAVEAEKLCSPVARPERGDTTPAVKPKKTPVSKQTPVASTPSLVSTRKPLTTKTTNSDLVSPIKLARSEPSLKGSNKISKDVSDPPVKNIILQRSTSFTAEDQQPQPETESGRPSRRARPSVNYALPNLRDKMRREAEEPTKPRASRKSTVPTKAKPSSAEVASEAVKIKSEPRDEIEGEGEMHWRNINAAADTDAIDIDDEEPNPELPEICHSRSNKRRVSSLHSSLLLRREEPVKHNSGSSSGNESSFVSFTAAGSSASVASGGLDFSMPVVLKLPSERCGSDETKAKRRISGTNFGSGMLLGGEVEMGEGAGDGNDGRDVYDMGRRQGRRRTMVV